MNKIETAIVFERDKVLTGGVASSLASPEVLRRQSSQKPSSSSVTAGADNAATGVSGSTARNRQPRRFRKTLP
jgi:hypothetical protein